MDSFNPTPEWVGQSMNATWGVLEVWGFPMVLGAALFLWAAPQVTKTVNSVKAAEYETASPIDGGVQEARERMQRKLAEDSAVADKLRKEKEEEERKDKLDRLKNGPKARKSALGRDYNPLLGSASGNGGGARPIGRVNPCAGGG